MKALYLKKTLVCCVAIGVLSLGIAVFATNVIRMHHPNLEAAQSFIERAIAKVHAAQEANEFDMHGHAAKAIELLDQAYTQIKLAAEAADHRR